MLPTSKIFFFFLEADLLTVDVLLHRLWDDTEKHLEEKTALIYLAICVNGHISLQSRCDSKNNVSDGSSFSYPMNLNTLKYRDHEI